MGIWTKKSCLTNILDGLETFLRISKNCDRGISKKKYKNGEFLRASRTSRRKNILCKKKKNMKFMNKNLGFIVQKS